jgi:glycosyltransferase involved in cell wall biosynthesis
MRIAYANACYLLDGVTGRNVHVKQFVDNATALGHEIWMSSGSQHPGVRHLPTERVKRLLTLREMDVIYFRLEDGAPSALRATVFPYRQLCGSPIVVWEFNVSPEYGAVIGRSRQEIDNTIRELRSYGKRCALAICVSDALAGYVRKHLDIKRVITVPNGSDPQLFRPDVSPVGRVERSPDRLNVVWIGSADLNYNNFDLLREAADSLWAQGEGERIRFHIIGNGLRRMREMPANVVYHGSEDYESLPRWLAAMDVGLCLYRSGPADYNSPLKLFDYMASGLAVAGTHQSQVRQVFEQLGQLDLLFSADDANALVAILLRLSSDRDRVRRLGEAGRRLVIERYNWQRAARDTFREIECLLQAKR